MDEDHTTGPAPAARSDDLLRLAIDDVPIFVFAVDREGILTLARGRCERGGIGSDASELAGRSLFELYGDQAGLADDLRRALAGETVRSRHRIDGLPFAAQHAPLLDASGAVVGATGWHLEVSELARAEEQHALLARAVQHASDGVLVIDAAHRVIRYANAAYERITGYPMHELVGRPVAVLQSEHADPALCKRIDESIQKESQWKGCLVGRRKDGGDYEAQASISAVRDASGSLAGTVCVARDTTDLDRLQRRLERGQRLEAIGRLAGGIAHNFNNLLTSILGYSEMCEVQAEPGGGVAEGLAEIRRAAERGARLIAQLLAFSRTQPVERQPIVLKELLSSLDAMLRRILPETIELRIRSDNAARLLGDRVQIEQVVLNLVMNAVDAMPYGGVLTLVGDRAPRDGGSEDAASDLPPGDYAVLGVEDTGVGMSELQLEHIFEPFYTTKEIGKATGLGLATVHSIVERCGGTVRVTSQPGKGTAFRVYFPAPATSAAPRVDRAEVDSPAPRRETVLYVEDDVHVRTVVARMLRRLGYRALVARDAEEALATARENGASIDLLLTDVVMPRRSGIDLADEVRGLVPRARVLFVSGYTSDALHAQLLDDPRVGFLAKPFQTAALDGALRSLLDAPKGQSPA